MPDKCAQDFEATQRPWVAVGKWERWAESRGVKITKGKRHNRTDGEVHYILRYGEKLHDMHANAWDWRTKGWQEAIDWIECNARH